MLLYSHPIEDRVTNNPCRNLEISTHCLYYGHTLMLDLGIMTRAMDSLIRLSQSGLSSDVGVGLISL